MTYKAEQVAVENEAVRRTLAELPEGTVLGKCSKAKQQEAVARAAEWREILYATPGMPEKLAEQEKEEQANNRKAARIREMRAFVKQGRDAGLS